MSSSPQPSSPPPSALHPAPCVFFAGGGTGGHLYPGIAVAEALVAARPEVRCVFLGTQRPIDRTILDPTGFEFIPQPIVPIRRSIGGLLRFWQGWRHTKDLVGQLLRQRRPAAVLGLGGYAAGAAVKLAGKARVPAALLNPDVIPGKANQYLMHYVTAVCCQFEGSAAHVAPAHRDKIRLTGCPVRGHIRDLAERATPTREAALGRLGLEARLHTLVVTGASQGARTVNEAVLAALGQMTVQGWQVLHLSGKEHADAVRAGYRDLAREAAKAGKPAMPSRVIDFTAGMADVWAAADLVISRAGGSTCAELTACGLPAVLLPYPYHKDKHQRLNAQVLAGAGAAVLHDDRMEARKNAEQLRPVLESLLFDADKRQAMAAASRALGKPSAARAVAEVILGMIGPGRGV